MNRVKELIVGSSVVKYREPENHDQAKIGILLHGWTGDESSMWVFGDKLNQNWFLIAPRAPYPTPGIGFGGFSWVNQTVQQWPTYHDFFPAVSFLNELLENFAVRFSSLDFTKYSVMGFSQGAAMSVVFAGVETNRIEKLVLLSGFLPEGYEGYTSGNKFNEVDVFIGHGSKDDVVPVSKAYEAKKLFDGNSRSLGLCISDVGHRLGSDCFKALQKFTNA